MTKAAMFEVIKEFVKASAISTSPEGYEEATIEDAIQFLDKEIELVNKRNSKKSGSSKKAKENEPIKEAILEVLSDSSDPMTTAEITTADKVQAFGTDDKAISSNKVTALLVQLRKAGLVKREYVKKVAKWEISNLLVILPLYKSCLAELNKESCHFVGGNRLVQLRKAGLVKREYVKKVAYFSLGNENEGEDTTEDESEDTSEEW